MEKRGIRVKQTQQRNPRVFPASEAHFSRGEFSRRAIAQQLRRPFKIHRAPDARYTRRRRRRRRSFQICFATRILGKPQPTARRPSALIIYTGRAISYGQRFWPITLTRLTRGIQSANAAYYVCILSALLRRKVVGHRPRRTMRGESLARPRIRV